jgi:hypothetical protein
MIQENAYKLAEVLKAMGCPLNKESVLHSGGGIWLVWYERIHDGKIVCFSDDCVCVYDSLDDVFDGLERTSIDF